MRTVVPASIVRVMLMKVLAPFSDPGSTPGSSTRAGGDGTLGEILGTADYSSGADGCEMVSTGSVVGTGDIRKAFSVTKQTIIAKDKPLTMAAAA